MRNWRAVVITAMAGVVLFGIGAATGSARALREVDAKVSVARSHPDEVPHEQTWPKNYGDTSCAEWMSDMDPDSRYVAGADMLAAWKNASPSLQPKTEVLAFEFEVTSRCSDDIGQNLANVSYAVYRQQNRPWSE